MFGVILLIIIVAGIYFFLKFTNKTKRGNVAAANDMTSPEYRKQSKDASSNDELTKATQLNFQSEKKEAQSRRADNTAASEEYWQESKHALSNGDFDKAVQLAFQARKKEAQSRGYDLSEDDIFGNPLHAKRAASEVDRFEIPIAGVSQETIAKLKTEVTLGVLKGEGPRAIERQTRDFLEDFEWPEFDQLCNKFMSTNEWPPFLDIVPAYYEMQTFPIERLLKELKKEQLLQLSRKYSVNAKKYQTKKVIIKLLINIIPERDRAKILALVNEKWKPIYLREKRSLLVHMLSMGAYHDSSLSEYEAAEKVIGLPVKVQWWTACDEHVCSICSSRHGKIYTRAEVKKMGHPHPGCRCCLLPYIVEDN